MDAKIKEQPNDFLAGAKDALPILIGYFAVSVTFGVATVSYGFNPWIPVIISLTNYTGSGQALGVQLMAAETTTLIELTLAMLVINIRYSLMSLSLSQRLDPKTRLWQRFILAFGVTDENFALAMSKKRELSFKYLLGIELAAFLGWLGGTALGAFVGAILPEIVLQAFGIALPAMFVAIILPPCRKSLPITLVVLASVGISCLFTYVPVINELSSGWVYIICGIVTAVAASVFFPVTEESDSEKEQEA